MDGYRSVAMDVYFAVEVAGVHPIVTVVSMITLIINRITFRFMLALISKLKGPLLAKCRLLPANSGNSEMQYYQCTPLIASYHSVDARSEVAECRVWVAASPKS